MGGNNKSKSRKVTYEDLYNAYICLEGLKEEYEELEKKIQEAARVYNKLKKRASYKTRCAFTDLLGM